MTDDAEKPRRLPRTVLRDIQRRPGGPTDASRAADSTLIPRSELDAAALAADPGRAARFRAAQGPLISRRPHVEALIGGAMAIAWEELKKLKEAAISRKLDPSEERHYRYLVDSIVKLTREQREQQKQEALEEMDADTLIEQSLEALKVLGEGR